MTGELKKDMGGIHMGASAAFLNGTGPLSSNGDFNIIRSKKSLDQYIADKIADVPEGSVVVLSGGNVDPALYAAVLNGSV